MRLLIDAGLQQGVVKHVFYYALIAGSCFTLLSG
jgi:hypothetical protein